MILVTILVCALIGAVCVKLYWNSEERALQRMLGPHMSGDELEQLIEDLTVHNTPFIVMAAVCALLCVAALIFVSRIFTKLLTQKLMQPLNMLEQAAERIQNNDFSQPLIYHGDAEFERVCAAFNDMQWHLKTEKDKNARYEKARQEMIAGISHDLRSPLTAIQGSVKAVLDGVAKEPEQQKRFLQAAYRRSGEMDVLLQELFYFSKLETGGIPLKRQNLDLAGYLKAYFTAKKDLPAYTDAEFVLDIPEVITQRVPADPEALQRILDNILSNSRKYADCSPLRMYVSLRREDGFQSITLQDNGRGVPPEKLKRIFDEFYRVDESRGKKEGSGLGLYIVKSLCEEMGGQVSADMDVRREGFAGLAITLRLKEGEISDGGQRENSDR